MTRFFNQRPLPDGGAFREVSVSNRVYPHPIIAREGWPILAGALIAFLASWCLDLGVITFLLFALFIFCLQFFRDPAREAPEDPRAVVSPVDGRVCKVEKTTNPETGEDCVKISIFMNVFSVHSQKAPVTGVVEKVTYTPGLFVNRKRAQRRHGPHGRRPPRHLHPGRRPRRPPHHLLRDGRPAARARRALRLHPLRLTRGRVSPARGRGRRRDRRQGDGRDERHREALIPLCGASIRMEACAKRRPCRCGGGVLLTDGRIGNAESVPERR